MLENKLWMECVGSEICAELFGICLEQPLSRILEEY